MKIAQLMKNVKMKNVFQLHVLILHVKKDKLVNMVYATKSMITSVAILNLKSSDIIVQYLDLIIKIVLH